MFTPQYNLDKIKEYTVNDYKTFAVGTTITVSGTVQYIDISGIYSEARAIHIYVVSDDTTNYVLRYFYDGGTPTSSTGIPRKNDDEFYVFELSNIQKFAVIEDAASTATTTTLYITYLK